jgi:hypothetical protein
MQSAVSNGRQFVKDTSPMAFAFPLVTANFKPWLLK